MSSDETTTGPWTGAPSPSPFQPSYSLLGHPPATPSDDALDSAWRAVELWRHDKAEGLLATLGALSGQRSTARLLVEALLARQSGDTESARSLFEKAWPQTEDDSHLRTLVGVESAHHLHRLGEVEAATDRLLVSDPDASPLRPRWLLAAAQLDLQQGRPEQARLRLNEAQSQAEEQRDLTRITAAELALASLECSQGQFQAGEEYAHRALGRARELNDIQRQGGASHALAQLAAQQGQDDRAATEARAAEGRFRQVGDQRGRAASLRLQAELAGRAKRPAEAHDLLTEAIGLLDALGDRRGRAATLHEQAILCTQQGLSARARVLLDEVLREARHLGDRQAQAASLHLLAQVELREGANERARELLSASTEVLHALGNRQDWAASLVMLAQLDARQGQLEQGISRLEQAVAVLRELGSGMLAPAEQALDQLREARTLPFRRLLSQAVQALGQGKLQAAEDAARQALALSETAGRPDVEAIAHFQLAQVFLAQRKPSEAVPHLATADVLLGRQGKLEQQAVVRILLERSRTG